MLGLLLLGSTGSLVELILLDHYEDAWQYVPLVVMGLAVAIALWHMIRPRNAWLLGQPLTQPQASEIYTKAFIHLNLNTGTREEILLIPGAGPRMAREFAEYRPWKNWVQFDKEIGKYVGPKETARLWRYVVTA